MTDTLQYVDEARALLATFATIAADVKLRALALDAKCSELERALRFVDTLAARRSVARAERAERERNNDAQTQQTHESIADAIQRARQIREALAAKHASSSDSVDEEDEQGNASNDNDDALLDTDASLQTILAMAKSIRARTPHDSSTVNPTTARATAASASASALLSRQSVATQLLSEASTDQAALPPVRLEYPRRMRLLLERLRGIDANERVEPFRVAFCRRMTEHLALRSCSDHPHQLQPIGRVQVPFAMQTTRLQNALAQLERFVCERLAPAKALAALETPTLATAFPVYTRIQHATRMFKVLRDEAHALAQRAPPLPLPLSPAAVAHRDAMLARIRNKRTPQQQAAQSPAAAAAVTNAALATAWRSVVSRDDDAHSALFEKLQTAWDADHAVGSAVAAATDGTATPSTAYALAVRETVLTDTSSLVLALFKTIFCDTPDAALAPLDVTNMLLLLRLVDSVALADGRRVRSVVAAHQPT